MAEIKDLLEAGVHFGHQSSRWNPKMKKYIFASRNGIHIIDLQKSLKALHEAQRARVALAAPVVLVDAAGAGRQRSEHQQQRQHPLMDCHEGVLD